MLPIEQVYVVEGPEADTLPVALKQVKEQCRIMPDVTDEDQLLRSYISSAELLVEKLTETSIRAKTYALTLSGWPVGLGASVIRLTKAPLLEVLHVKYYDSTDTFQTLPSDKYEVWQHAAPPKLVILNDNLPVLTDKRSQAIEIRFRAGYDSSRPIPENLQVILLELVGYWYQNREAYGRFPEGDRGRLFENLLETVRWRVYP